MALFLSSCQAVYFYLLLRIMNGKCKKKCPFGMWQVEKVALTILLYLNIAYFIQALETKNNRTRLYDSIKISYFLFYLFSKFY